MTVGHDFQLHALAAGRTRGRGKSRCGPVTVTRVSPRALMVALRLADGNPARLRVLSDREVLVVNNPGRRP